MQIRRATEADDDTLVRHYLAVWESYGTPEEHYYSDAPARVRAFIQDTRLKLGLGVFVATVHNVAVGSVACQLQSSPYPDVVMPEHRRYGYIWSVFVEPDHRKRGIAQALVESALGHLRSIGCTKAVLHSSDAGKQLYAQIGFQPASEMRLVL
jgi:GNAT superfamily N-acetyltransferase